MSKKLIDSMLTHIKMAIMVIISKNSAGLFIYMCPKGEGNTILNSSLIYLLSFLSLTSVSHSFGTIVLFYTVLWLFHLKICRKLWDCFLCFPQPIYLSQLFLREFNFTFNFLECVCVCQDRLVSILQLPVQPP